MEEIYNCHICNISLDREHTDICYDCFEIFCSRHMIYCSKCCLNECINCHQNCINQDQFMEESNTPSLIDDRSH